MVRAKELTPWWRVGLAVLRPAFASTFKLEVHGTGNLPATGCAVLASNHRSVIDGVLLALVGARCGRATRFLVAAEVFEFRIPGWTLRTFDQIPIRRGSQDAGALDEAIAALHGGSVVGVFPEGRVNEEASMLRGRTGVARIALAAGAPVVPLGLWGTQTRWPRSGIRWRLPLRPRVAVEIGAAVEPHGDVDSPADVRAFTEEVMRAIEASAAQARSRVERQWTRRPTGRRRWR
ncbi:MAG: lysophospholipid acyltransferase family protein [Actinomycetota bacterium]